MVRPEQLLACSVGITKKCAHPRLWVSHRLTGYLSDGSKKCYSSRKQVTSELPSCVGLWKAGLALSWPGVPAMKDSFMALSEMLECDYENCGSWTLWQHPGSSLMMPRFHTPLQHTREHPTAVTGLTLWCLRLCSAKIHEELKSTWSQVGQGWISFFLVVLVYELK